MVIDPDTYVPLCPYTGKPLKLIKVDDSGNWIARGEVFMTKPFVTKRLLVKALAPEGARVLGEVVVTRDAGDNVPQSDPVADLVEREKDLDSKLAEAGLGA